jgi:protein-tyrosine phosphatase
MFDLHSHILPGVDDGAANIGVALGMARRFAEDGVQVVACTPHILPGLYSNTGPSIREAVVRLQAQIDEAGIDLKLVTGADNHIAPEFVQGLRSGTLLSLNDSRYVLMEPPHHVVPQGLESLFFSVVMAGYVPVLTHPERLSWIESRYELIKTLAGRGVWMQITAGSLLGSFGRRPRYWAERMLSEGLVHILATDAHDEIRRPPALREGRLAAERLIGAAEAEHLVVTRPAAILADTPPNLQPSPGSLVQSKSLDADDENLEASRNARGVGAWRLRSYFR